MPPPTHTPTHTRASFWAPQPPAGAACLPAMGALLDALRALAGAGRLDEPCLAGSFLQSFLVVQQHCQSVQAAGSATLPVPTSAGLLAAWLLNGALVSSTDQPDSCQCRRRSLPALAFSRADESLPDNPTFQRWQLAAPIIHQLLPALLQQGGPDSALRGSDSWQAMDLLLLHTQLLALCVVRCRKGVSSSAGGGGTGGSTGASNSGGGNSGGAHHCADISAFLGSAFVGSGTINRYLTAEMGSSRALLLMAVRVLTILVSTPWPRVDTSKPRRPACAACTGRQLLLIVEAATARPESALALAGLHVQLYRVLHAYLAGQILWGFVWLPAFMEAAAPPLSAFAIAAARQLPRISSQSHSGGGDDDSSRSSHQLAESVLLAVVLVMMLPGGVLSRPAASAPRQQLLEDAQLALMVLPAGSVHRAEGARACIDLLEVSCCVGPCTVQCIRAALRVGHAALAGRRTCMAKGKALSAPACHDAAQAFMMVSGCSITAPHASIEELWNSGAMVDFAATVCRALSQGDVFEVAIRLLRPLTPPEVRRQLRLPQVQQWRWRSEQWQQLAVLLLALLGGRAAALAIDMASKASSAPRASERTAAQLRIVLPAAAQLLHQEPLLSLVNTAAPARSSDQRQATEAAGDVAVWYDSGGQPACCALHGPSARQLVSLARRLDPAALRINMRSCNNLACSSIGWDAEHAMQSMESTRGRTPRRYCSEACAAAHNTAQTGQERGE